MADAISSLLRGLFDPADSLLDPGKRIFWPFFAGSLVIGLVALLVRGASLGAAARALVSRRIWWHRSARGDYALIAAKAALRIVLFGAFGLSTLAIAAITASWLRRHLGLHTLHISPVAVGAIFTIVAFLVEDWSRYFVHRLLHRVPALWEIHKVHHSAEVLTPFSLYRTHPVEAGLNGARGAIAIGLVTGVCVWAFGPALHAWEVLGVDAIGFVWTLFGANLRHSHVWLSYGPRLEKIFVSPAQHQVHHSRDAKHFDRNFGTILAIWDWMAGSLYVTTSKREAIHFGLPDDDALAGQHGLGALLVTPFIASIRKLLGVFAPLGKSRARQQAIAAMVAIASLTIAGCVPARFDRVALLESFGQCTMDTLTRFEMATEALEHETATFAMAGGDPSHSAQARAAWEQAIDLWEQAEMMRYGPAGDPQFNGGRGLRDAIYSWPVVNRCLIEQQIVSGAYDTSVANLQTSSRGLAAIEYLLFYTGTDNACPTTDPINAMGTWAAIPPIVLSMRKANYAHALAADLVTRARDLNAAWSPNGFYTQLVSAGRGSTLFDTQQFAISSVAEAAFYVDTDVYNLRLGRALGHVVCTSPTCPEMLESQWADRGKQHLRNNLAGLRQLLQGCSAGQHGEGDPLGFDDMLTAAGAPSLATEMNHDLDAIAAAIDAIPGDSLKTALTENRIQLEAVHRAYGELVSFLKMEFSTTLQIQSSRVEGDAD